MSLGIFRTKSVEQTLQDTEEPEHQLKKNLGALDLIVFGVGVSVGAGIFVLTGHAAATNAGPAIALSFLIAGLGCGLAALCYAELASPCRPPEAPIPTPTQRWVSCSPGSSAGT